MFSMAAGRGAAEDGPSGWVMDAAVPGTPAPDLRSASSSGHGDSVGWRQGTSSENRSTSSGDSGDSRSDTGSERNGYVSVAYLFYSRVETLILGWPLAILRN
jgi:hypothetical protein